MFHIKKAHNIIQKTPLNKKGFYTIVRQLLLPSQNWPNICFAIDKQLQICNTNLRIPPNFSTTLRNAHSPPPPKKNTKKPHSSSSSRRYKSDCQIPILFNRKHKLYTVPEYSMKRNGDIDFLNIKPKVLQLSSLEKQNYI